MIAALISLALVAAQDPKCDSLGPCWSPSTSGVHAQVRQKQIVPLTQVTATIAKAIPGHLLDAGLEAGDNGRQVYRVRWAAADGRRIDVIADAATGVIQREEGR